MRCGLVLLDSNFDFLVLAQDLLSEDFEVLMQLAVSRQVLLAGTQSFVVRCEFLFVGFHSFFVLFEEFVMLGIEFSSCSINFIV